MVYLMHLPFCRQVPFANRTPEKNKQVEAAAGSEQRSEGVDSPCTIGAMIS